MFSFTETNLLRASFAASDVVYISDALDFRPRGVELKYNRQIEKKKIPTACGVASIIFLIDVRIPEKN